MAVTQQPMGGGGGLLTVQDSSAANQIYPVPTAPLGAVGSGSTNSKSTTVALSSSTPSSESSTSAAMAVTQQPMGGGGLLAVPSVEGNRDWSTGLFGCFEDFKTCIMAYFSLPCILCSIFGIMAYFCLPCTLCSISSRIGDCALMPFCVPNAPMTMRTRIRTLGGIQGSICGDCLAIAFCPMCGVCQMAREIDRMGL